MNEELPQQLATYEDFWDWYKTVDLRAEWVDGKAVLLPAVTVRHQLVLGFLSVYMVVFCSKHNLGVVLPGRIQMHLTNPPRGREPDILFVSQANSTRLQEEYLDGPADIAVEIISDETVECDRQDKFAEYEMAGVREYWLIDPEQEQAEFYQLGAEGRYQLAFGGKVGRYESAVLFGLALQVEWLWQDSLPINLAISQL